MQQERISTQTLRRLPTYLMYLRSLKDDGSRTISAAAIAAALDLGEVQVRKDLAAVSVAGRPKVGYLVSDLKHDLEVYLGRGRRRRAVIAGAGSLGQALMHHDGLADYGIEIVAAFDSDPKHIGAQAKAGIPVLPVEEMAAYCARERIAIGILAVPADKAQTCLDEMAAGGIKAVWSFAPIHLNAPNGVRVQHESMTTSLALLVHAMDDVGEAQ